MEGAMAHIRNASAFQRVHRTGHIDPTRDAVRRALHSGTRVVALGCAIAGVPAWAAPFPAVLPLASLLPAGGGDGSSGFVLNGIDAFDQSGSSVASAGDVNGDGHDDLVIGAVSANQQGRR